ncbi:NPP1 family protein [Streptomyces sp. NPDC001089]
MQIFVRLERTSSSQSWRSRSSHMPLPALASSTTGCRCWGEGGGRSGYRRCPACVGGGPGTEPCWWHADDAPAPCNGPLLAVRSRRSLQATRSSARRPRAARRSHRRLAPRRCSRAGRREPHQPARDGTAVAAGGYVNPGLGLGGAVNGHCHDRAQLDHANTYSREKCNNGWCAIMYASYFEKDQSSDGVGEIAGGANGHRHDWEHVVVWVQNNTVKYVSVSQHKGWATYGRSSIRFDPSGTHPKVVYHKDGGLTHDFRIANAGDDNPVENVTGGCFYPRLVGWNGYPSVDIRNKFVYHTPFGAASIKIGTGVIEGQLAAAQGGIDTPIAFNAYA